MKQTHNIVKESNTALKIAMIPTMFVFISSLHKEPWRQTARESCRRVQSGEVLLRGWHLPGLQSVNGLYQMEEGSGHEGEASNLSGAFPSKNLLNHGAVSRNKLLCNLRILELHENHAFH